MDPTGNFEKRHSSEASRLMDKVDNYASPLRGVWSWLPGRFFGTSNYTAVDDPGEPEDNAASLALELRKKTTSLRRWRCISAVLTAALVLTWASVPASTTEPAPARYPQPDEGTDNILKWMKDAETADGHYWCGPTTEEAKKRGCTFNKLHNRWMSPHCAADFEPARDAVFKALDGDVPEFVFYKDEDGKPGAKISEEELNNLDILTPAWTTVGHHMTHCMYLLLQGAASLNLGTKADMVVHAWEHAGHCASVIMNITKTAPGWQDVASFGHTQSGVCW